MREFGSLQLRVSSCIENVALVGRCIRALTAPLLGERAGSDMELATCEALNNIIEHAYAQRDDQTIVVEWDRVAHGARVRVHDWGKPLPAGALEATLPDTDGVAVAGLPEGGFGIGLLKALTDEIAYSRNAEGRNTLVLVRLHNQVPNSGSRRGGPVHG